MKKVIRIELHSFGVMQEVHLYFSLSAQQHEKVHFYYHF